MIEGIVLGVIVMVVGGYGLYQVAFKQGYVRGHEDATHDTITFIQE